MKKSLFLIVFMIVTILSYGQQITFQKNTNLNASELLQHLNKGVDSLLLESKTSQILKVDIFSDDFSERIDVYSHKSKIDLKQLPIGNYVIQAKIGQKWIVMYLEKNEAFKIASTNSKEMALNHNQSEGRTNQRINKNKSPIYYWVVSESNSNFGSSKSMRLEYKENVAKLISKNRLELKSNIGKGNKLLVYAIYNKSQFMNKQFRNPKYYKTTEKSTFFNTKPYYTSNSEINNNSNF